MIVEVADIQERSLDAVVPRHLSREGLLEERLYTNRTECKMPGYRPSLAPPSSPPPPPHPRVATDLSNGVVHRSLPWPADDLHELVHERGRRVANP